MSRLMEMLDSAMARIKLEGASSELPPPELRSVPAASPCQPHMAKLGSCIGKLVTTPRGEGVLLALRLHHPCSVRLLSDPTLAVLLPWWDISPAVPRPPEALADEASVSEAQENVESLMASWRKSVDSPDSAKAQSPPAVVARTP